MLNQWDVISCPIGVMRGFRNPNPHALVVYSVVGGTDEECGRIAWHPDVVRAAESTGSSTARTATSKGRKLIGARAM